MKRLIPLFAGLLAVPALAQSLNSLDEIDRAVLAFTGTPMGLPGGAAAPVDRRLRLAQCAAPLALGWYGAGRQAVQVRCPVAGGWTLYVPVAGAGTVAEAPVVVRGDAITIMADGDGFAVAQPGEALESGAPGAWIKVRGIDPKAPVLRGKVLRAGMVGVALP